MRACLRGAVAAFVAFLAGCGARTSLGESSAGASSSGDGAGGSGPAAPRCPAWVKTRDAVQISDIASIVQAQALVVTPAGALAGYADAQFPPVDPSWHVRPIAFEDGALGADQTLLHRDTSGLGWTAISLAVADGRAAATASDDTQGAQFVEIDASSGAPIAGPIIVPGEPARFMLATSNGYSVLRSKFDPSGAKVPPVSLSSLDAHGQLGATGELVGASTPLVAYSRVGFDDGSFALVWTESSKTCACDDVRMRHFDASGAPLAGPATLHTFGPKQFGSIVVAASSNTLLVAWTEQQGGELRLFARPFDAEGQPRGSSHFITQPAGPNAPTLGLAAAPGGDFLLAWAEEGLDGSGQVHVQSVGPDGAAEGAPTLVAEARLDEYGALFVVVSGSRAMVLFAADVAGLGIEAFAVPLHCPS